MGIKIIILVKYLIFGEYVKIRESLYTKFICWFTTILDHIATSLILFSRYEGSCMVLKLANTPSNTHTLVGTKKCEISIQIPIWYKKGQYQFNHSIKYVSKYHMVFTSLVVTFLATLLMNMLTNIVMNDWNWDEIHANYWNKRLVYSTLNLILTFS